MNWFTGIMVYIIVWWMVLLMVLPLWIRRPEQVEEGHDPGAPAEAMIGKKLLVTTLVAAAVFAVIFAIIEADLISFRQNVG